MEVILTQDIRNLGYKDDVVKVRPGYGRNYLIPQGMATAASESNKKQLAETIKQRAFKADKIKKEAEKTAEKLNGAKLTVATKVGDSGKIFGSVTTIQVVDALKKQGFDIDRRIVTLEDDHIKTIGTYTANINLHKEVRVKLEFDVVSE